MAANETELKGLMVAGLHGDAAAYRTLLSNLSRYLRGYYKAKLSGFAQSASEAEDLVQEVLLAIHTRRHTYNAEEPFTPWMHAIARYKLIDHLRRTRGLRTNVPLDDAAEVIAHNDQSEIESTYDLKTLLSEIPDKMRRAIQCVKIEGLSVAEAAERCGMSESAVKVNVHRGLKSLAALVRREDREHED